MSRLSFRCHIPSFWTKPLYSSFASVSGDLLSSLSGISRVLLASFASSSPGSLSIAQVLILHLSILCYIQHPFLLVLGGISSSHSFVLQPIFFLGSSLSSDTIVNTTPSFESVHTDHPQQLFHHPVRSGHASITFFENGSSF